MSGTAPTSVMELMCKAGERGTSGWWRSAVVYQVYVRSFADDNGDGIGDLKGLAQRLSYLGGRRLDSLPIDAVWLTPVFQSPMRDGGYDISDYRRIDPLFGDLDDLRAIIGIAHRLGLRVLLDWVPNHTSDAHPWFVESRRSRDSPRRDWYVWADGRAPGVPPNNWRSTFDAVGPAWTFDPGTGQWYLHSFSPLQPDLNWDNPAVRAAMLDVLSFWLGEGVDGMRIDVVQRLGKDPALADNPMVITKPSTETAGRRHDEDWPTVFPRLAEIRAGMDRYPGRVLVGEVYVLDERRLLEYVAPGRLHLAHNFLPIRQPWGIQLAAAIDRFEGLAAPQVTPAWFLNNHDHRRAPTRYGGGRTGLLRARAAALLLLTLRGAIFLYQGEELGLTDTTIADGQAVDLDGRDGVRTPLPWRPAADAGLGHGFTRGTPWLPVASGQSVEEAAADPGSVFSLYQQLLWLRRGSSALYHGSYRRLHLDERLFAFAREHRSQRLVTVVNYSGAEIPVIEVEELVGVRLRSLVARSSLEGSYGTLAADQAALYEASA
jgi:alpha-glucosidase